MAAALGMSLDAQLDSLDIYCLGAARGKMPGYSGHVPGMRNHVIGRRYAEATCRAGECAEVLREGKNPSDLVGSLDDRPQGRHFLYAQMAKSAPDGIPRLVDPHFGKRKPLLNGAATGEVDYRLVPKVIGGLGDHTMKTVKSVSISQLPYANRRFVTRKEYPEEGLAADDAGHAQVPGYTGHQPGAQHLYAKPYGQISSDLKSAAKQPTERAKQFMCYADDRPTGKSLQAFNATRLQIPGYQGFIPGKDNHVYGRTCGDGAKLALEACTLMKQGQDPSHMEQLVDYRPQGRVDLYAERQIKNRHHTAVPLMLHMGKGMMQHSFQERGPDHKLRDKACTDMSTVSQAKHKLVGYTGHIHGEQHMFAKSYGETTRELNGLNASHSVDDDLLYYADTRPHRS
uniref:Uncharacterized protein n=1 Tax=Pyramimonas obovata TaxID=1411642 RepID=A0A7S0WLB7_9CHLO|mmetsp:Transcript_29003/g.63443  ORF Transcript_29003/g.63443 Transcript_29003/m.63443 type:complete len:399 (+) Transcript_29003:124-1320(+)